MALLDDEPGAALDAGGEVVSGFAPAVGERLSRVTGMLLATTKADVLNCIFIFIHYQRLVRPLSSDQNSSTPPDRFCLARRA